MGIGGRCVRQLFTLHIQTGSRVLGLFPFYSAWGPAPQNSATHSQVRLPTSVKTLWEHQGSQAKQDYSTQRISLDPPPSPFSEILMHIAWCGPWSISYHGVKYVIPQALNIEFGMWLVLTNGVLVWGGGHIEVWTWFGLISSTAIKWSVWSMETSAADLSPITSVGSGHSEPRCYQPMHRSTQEESKRL